MHTRASKLVPGVSPTTGRLVGESLTCCTEVSKLTTYTPENRVINTPVPHIAVAQLHAKIVNVREGGGRGDVNTGVVRCDGIHAYMYISAGLR